MCLAELAVHNFRSVEKAELSLDPGHNLIWGSNAAGKTSLLEAIYMLGRGRSFRTALLRMNIHRNSATVVADSDRFIRMDGDDNPVAKPGQGLVDGVVDNLENHVVQAGTVIGITDVHTRPLTDGVETL